MNDFYQKFLEKVGKARRMSPEEVDQVAQGRVWTGEQALGHRLIDEIGGLSRAVELLKQKAGMAPQTRIQLVEYPRQKSVFELLASRVQGTTDFIPGGLSRWLTRWDQIENLRRHPWLARLPFTVEFQ